MTVSENFNFVTLKKIGIKESWRELSLLNKTNQEFKQ